MPGTNILINRDSLKLILLVNLDHLPQMKNVDLEHNYFIPFKSYSLQLLAC